jgi:hypothetical protein
MDAFLRFSCIAAVLLASACGDDGDTSSASSGGGSGGEGQGGAGDGGSIASTSSAGGGDTSSSSGDAGASCSERAAGAYLLAVSIQLSNDTPLYFDAAVTQSDVGISIELTPMRTPYRDAGTPLVPVGTSFTVRSGAIGADGGFSVDTGNVAITGEANPFGPADMVVSMMLTGTACPGEPDGSFCGTVSGSVSEPIELALIEGENFFAFNEQDAIPVYDCAGSLADSF